jgi:hypothetical protein
MATFWRSLMQKVQSLRKQWAERRKRNKPAFPYSYRQASIPQQLIRELENKEAEPHH